MIRIVDALPVQAYIDAEKRIGPICFKLLGESLPTDLCIYISEIKPDIDEKNATWSFKKPPRNFKIFPSDQQ